MAEVERRLGRWVDRGVALGLVVLAAVVWNSAAAIPPSFLDTGFGADYLPKLLAVVLVVLALTLLTETRNKDAETRTGTEPSTVLDGGLVARCWAIARRPLALAVLLAAFILAIDLGLLGSYPAAALFLFAAGLLLAGVSRRSLLLSAACSLLVTLAVYLLFTQVFTVLLP